MAKLHELLAAEASVAAAYNSISEETLKVFGKPDHFTKQTTAVSYFAEDEKNLNTFETKDSVTTVDERLDWQLGDAFRSYFDLLAQKDSTNQKAQADVELDGKVFLTGVPATYLLTLETKIGDLRKKFETIPTLQPGPLWIEDKNEGKWRTAEASVSFKTKKTIRPIILVGPTDKHPAQVEKISEDVAVAKIERTTWSGMWTSTQKSEVLARLDALLIALKQARQRANCQEVVKLPVAKRISEYLLNGTL